MSLNKITWNMQGAGSRNENKWSTYVQRLMKTYDVVCLQEVGSGPPARGTTTSTPPSWKVYPKAPTAGTWKFLEWEIKNRSLRGPGNRGYQIYYVLYGIWDTGANRVNLAICSNKKPDYLLYAGPGVTTAKGDSRPSWGMEFQTPGGTSESVFTLHALSGSGGDAGKLLGNIMATTNSPWVALGDFNCTPEQLAKFTSFKSLASKPVICGPNKPTHDRHRKIDYMVASNGQAQVVGQVQESSNWSDHRPVVYD